MRLFSIVFAVMLTASLSVTAVVADFSDMLKRDWIQQAELRYPEQNSPRVSCEEDALGAVDGVIDGKWGFHTALEPNPYWQVDLEETTDIGKVILYNRCDNCAVRNNDIILSLSDDGKTWNKVWQHDGTVFYGATDSKPLVVDFSEKPLRSRYLRLSLEGTTVLHLDEVEIYKPGSIENIALNKNATQSSTCEWSVKHKKAGAKTSIPDFVFRSVLESGRKLADDLRHQGIDTESAQAAFNRLEQSPFTEESYFALRRVVRELALQNPLLDFDTILFAKTSPSMFPHMSDQCLSYWHRGGGAICLVKNFKSGTPEIVELTTGWKNGTFFRPELSYDGKKVLFAYAEYDPAVAVIQDKVDKNNIAEENYFHLYEMDIATRQARQLTFGKYDDFDGRYLPDGRIVFLSTRKGQAIQTGKLDIAKMCEIDYPDSYVRCGGDNFRPVAVYTLHSIAPDGSDMRQISGFENFEWTPSIMNDGRIVYTRWDYVDRYAQHFISIWGKNPDGSKPTLIFGNYTVNPDIILEPRAIPGSSKMVFVASAHHSTFGGSLVLLDRNLGTEGGDPVERVTPDVKFPETEDWPRHYYANPCPLSENYYLLSWSNKPLPPHTFVSDEERNPSNSMGIYYYDRFGNLELLYRDERISCVNAIPFKSRPAPMDISSDLDWDGPLEGEFVVQNIYEGLEEYGFTKESQCIKRLRVVATVPKTQPQMNVPSLGITQEEPGKFVLGTVPVEPDGSVYFRVPSGVPYFFQALDENGVTIQTMRTLVDLLPGETTTCIGCHENREMAPPYSTFPTAVTRDPSKLVPDPQGTFPFRYSELVQPVLDKHCVSCHAPQSTDVAAAAFDLTAPNSYTSLLSFGGGAVKLNGPLYVEIGLYGSQAIRHLRSNPDVLQMEAVRSSAATLVSNSGGALKDLAFERDISIPGTAPASQSRLLTVLMNREEPRIESHADVCLSQEELYRLIVWMDLYALYQGFYSPEQERKLQEFRDSVRHLLH